MTALPRVSVSMPPDVETAIAQMRGIPKFSRMPMSQVYLYLIRLGLQQRQEWTRFREDGADNKAADSGGGE